MTANAFTEDRLRAKEAGMDEHIAKPVDGKLLINIIYKLMKHSFRGSHNEKKKRSKLLAVLLVMATGTSLLSGCGRKIAEKEDAETITVYLWSTSCMINMHHTSRNSFRISTLNL